MYFMYVFVIAIAVTKSLKCKHNTEFLQNENRETWNQNARTRVNKIKTIFCIPSKNRGLGKSLKNVETPLSKYVHKFINRHLALKA